MCKHITEKKANCKVLVYFYHMLQQIFQKKRSFYQNDDKIRKFANIGFTLKES